jgi:branched-subunit amino acid transport protein
MGAMPWLKRLVAGLLSRKPGFTPGLIHVGFVVDRVALGQVFLRVLQFSPANIIPPLLHIHLLPPHEVCDSSNQAAYCHHLGPKLGASFLTRHVGWKQNKKVRKKIGWEYESSLDISFSLTCFTSVRL